MVRLLGASLSSRRREARALRSPISPARSSPISPASGTVRAWVSENYSATITRYDTDGQHLSEIVTSRRTAAPPAPG